MWEDNMDGPFHFLLEEVLLWNMDWIMVLWPEATT